MWYPSVCLPQGQRCVTPVTSWRVLLRLLKRQTKKKSQGAVTDAHRQAAAKTRTISHPFLFSSSSSVVSCFYSLLFLQTHANASNTGSFNYYHTVTGGGTSHEAIISRNNGTELQDPKSARGHRMN
ncbi:hypothetical protein QQF64_022512 [Cirrhinus molitorella]|uniref:Uncharacterized protein n=1 Tax=Cirrhinus molitorella TaxID=172907 RepID=A0ABR3L521_9TELE